MPRNYRSPSPKRPKRYNSREEYNVREKRDRRYRSPSPVKRERKHSSPVRRNYKRNSRYSDSESEDDSSYSEESSSSDYSDDSDSEERDYTSSSSDSESSSEDERVDSRRSTKKNLKTIEKKRENGREKTRQKDNKEKKYKDEVDEEEQKSYQNSEKETSNRSKSENVRNLKKTQKPETVQCEDQEEYESQELNDTGKKYNGPPRFLVMSVDGKILTQKKIYTSNTGPKNAAQKAFNRLCNETNKRMEITVKKLDDSKGKEMTYFFKKEELNPPIEREIGGRKVVYRHKTVSC
jgi:hypothetical protein